MILLIPMLIISFVCVEGTPDSANMYIDGTTALLRKMLNNERQTNELQRKLDALEARFEALQTQHDKLQTQCASLRNTVVHWETNSRSMIGNINECTRRVAALESGPRPRPPESQPVPSAAGRKLLNEAGGSSSPAAAATARPGVSLNEGTAVHFINAGESVASLYHTDNGTLSVNGTLSFTGGIHDVGATIQTLNAFRQSWEPLSEMIPPGTLWYNDIGAGPLTGVMIGKVCGYSGSTNVIWIFPVVNCTACGGQNCYCAKEHAWTSIVSGAYLCNNVAYYGTAGACTPVPGGQAFAVNQHTHFFHSGACTGTGASKLYQGVFLV